MKIEYNECGYQGESKVVMADLPDLSYGEKHVCPDCDSDDIKEGAKKVFMSKKTDEEKLKALFTSFGIKFHEQKGVGENDNQVYLDADDDCDKVIGWGGFTTIFSFDEEGKFINVELFD
ncbi:MAG: hypothetical protein WCS56_00160 [Bacilli bacterium]